MTAATPPDPAAATGPASVVISHGDPDDDVAAVLAALSAVLGASRTATAGPVGVAPAARRGVDPWAARSRRGRAGSAGTGGAWRVPGTAAPERGPSEP